MRTLLRRLLVAVAAVSMATLPGALSAPAAAAPTWAPAASATVHPGVVMDTAGGQCTSNFVFVDRAGAVYLGQAAHCAGTGTATETDGCTSASLPLGTPVTIDGASKPGTLAYSSWTTMQARGETNPDVCAYNDFALVRVDPADVARVNPSVPHWGGPTALGPGSTTAGQQVVSYGNSPLRGGISVLSPKQGTSLGDEGAGWSHVVLTVTPGVPGDSGSGFMDTQGRAIGVLSTLNVAPLAGTNGVGDLSRELRYAQQTSGISGLGLVRGTAPFQASLL